MYIIALYYIILNTVDTVRIKFSNDRFFDKRGFLNFPIVCRLKIQSQIKFTDDKILF